MIVVHYRKQPATKQKPKTSPFCDFKLDIINMLETMILIFFHSSLHSFSFTTCPLLESVRHVLAKHECFHTCPAPLEAATSCGSKVGWMQETVRKHCQLYPDMWYAQWAFMTTVVAAS